MVMQSFWVGMLTHNRRYSGTRNSILLIINRDGKDVVNRYLDKGPTMDSPTPSKGEAKVYQTWGGENEEFVKADDDIYLRIGISGSDLWRPEHIVIWTESDKSHLQIVPVAIETEISATLSTDSDEGVSSIPIRRVASGDENTEIKRLLCIFNTRETRDSGTDSSLLLRVIREGQLVTDYTFPDTPQSDFEADFDNLYFVPVITPFIRQGLTDTSIQLRIQGTDAWNPSSIRVIGVDTESGRPNKLIPLVNTYFPEGTTLSTDSSEGKEWIYLPLIV
jgi:hypothetical protein